MEERRKGPPETWNDRVKAGRDKLPGGIHDATHATHATHPTPHGRSGP
jgi:hypothetical protein